MKIKSIDLEIVCGITSKLPETDKVEIAFAGKFKCREIFIDQCVDESKVFCAYISDAGKNSDYQFL